jgi:hypothetical protein
MVHARRRVALQLQLYENEGDPSASEFGGALIQYGNHLHKSRLYEVPCTVKAKGFEIGYVHYEADSSTHSADLASFLDSHGASWRLVAPRGTIQRGMFC